jgi:hypothetical protein
MCELAPLLTIKCAELSNLLSLVRGQKELENPLGYGGVQFGSLLVYLCVDVGFTGKG